MGFLNALGLMTRAEHDRIVLKTEEARDKFRDQVRDTCARAEKAESALSGARAENNRLTRGWNKCGDDLRLVRRQLDESEAEVSNQRNHIETLTVELANFRAQRDKDNAGRRERRAKAKAANDAAPKVAKKGVRAKS